MGANAGKDFKRGLLGAISLGTSEIKTGAGEYGDETLADALFPKTVNNWLDEGREASRRGKDAAQKALVDSAATQAALQPDAADAAIATKRAGALRLMTGRSRKNSFLTGG